MHTILHINHLLLPETKCPILMTLKTAIGRNPESIPSTYHPHSLCPLRSIVIESFFIFQVDVFKDVLPQNVCLHSFVQIMTFLGHISCIACFILLVKIFLYALCFHTLVTYIPCSEYKWPHLTTKWTTWQIYCSVYHDLQYFGK